MTTKKFSKLINKKQLSRYNIFLFSRSLIVWEIFAFFKGAPSIKQISQFSDINILSPPSVASYWNLKAEIWLEVNIKEEKSVDTSKNKSRKIASFFFLISKTRNKKNSIDTKIISTPVKGNFADKSANLKPEK